ncbi:MAG: hypothetical protein ACLQMT_10180 [Candidatus Acidiferrales bacterium]
MRNPFLSRGRLAFFTGCLVCLFAPTLSGQQLNSNTARTPLVQDWSSHHVVFSKPANYWQGILAQTDPRYLQQYYHQNKSSFLFGLGNKKPRPPFLNFFESEKIHGDWAVSLGAGGVAQGMYPAKFTFDSNAAPSCANDFAVFPINAPTGNTRANVVGTFTGEPGTGQTATITITPTGLAAVHLVLTAGATNTGTTFARSLTASTDAANLAAAINRNISATALDEVVAVASGATVTVYALTPGSRETLTDATTMAGTFTWAAVTAGTNGTQASIVAFNQLYSGTTPFCTGLSFPEFIFSYASGVGPVATSPTLSLDGKKIAYVENDANIGAILHVLTYATGATEYGTCTNTGLVTPTCAGAPVIPGSTLLSTGTDYMLPLGLVAANAATGAVGALDSFSSPFMHYGLDILYVGDNNGYLYSIYPTFTGTPAHAGGNFPLQLNTTASSTAPTNLTATMATPSVVTVTVANTLAALQSVTIAGVAPSGTCSAADVAAINGGQIVVTAAAGNFTFDIPTSTTAVSGCVLTNATVSPGTNILSAPSVDAGVTGNIFVGDSSANLYEVTGAGVKQATLALGENVNGGIRGGPLVDSSKSTGFAVTACSAGTVGETMALNAGLTQFNFTSTTMTMGGEAGNTAGLDTNLNENCTTPNYAMYDPMVDARYFVLGIGSATAANNGELTAAASGSAGVQIKVFQFISSVMQTTPEAKNQIGGSAHSVLSPLTEFYNPISGTITVTAVTTTAAGVVTVTVPATNPLAVNDVATVSGVTANLGNNCTAADVTAISAGLQTVATRSATQFTFNTTGLTTTSGAGCTVTGATATGGPDYMFLGSVQNAELYSFLLPAGASATTPTATNTADISGGTSGMIIDNDGTGGQESNLYYGTLATSTTICGATAAYCAVKLTQSLLQ